MRTQLEPARAGTPPLSTQAGHSRQAISAGLAFAIATVLGVEMTQLFTDFPAVPHARPY